jgi:hypothetical protein
MIVVVVVFAVTIATVLTAVRGTPETVDSSMDESVSIPHVKWTQRRNKLLLTVVENNIENGSN